MKVYTFDDAKNVIFVEKVEKTLSFENNIYNSIQMENYEEIFSLH